MAKQKVKKNDKSPKINKWLYFVFISILIFVAKLLYGLKIKKSKIDKNDGPFLIVGNHTSPIDFLFFRSAVFPKPLNYVVASNMYYTKVYGWYLRRYNTIPKRQFTADFGCIKQIKRFIDNGTSVLVFPEGRVTVDGTTGYINPSIGKLVKWLGCPVIAGVTKGGYVSNPKWGKKRSSKINLEIGQILTREQVKNLSAAEIAQIIVDNLSYNDNQHLIDNHLVIKGKNLAEGLEKLLYKCPKCGAEFKHSTLGNEMTCSACGNKISYGKDGIITNVTEDSVAFPLINEWYAYQREEIKKQVSDNDGFVLKDRVRYSLNNPDMKKFVDVEEGILEISKDGIKFVGEKNQLLFNIKNHESLAYKIGDDIEVSEEENIYRFTFLDGYFSAKYILAIEEIYKKYFA